MALLSQWIDYIQIPKKQLYDDLNALSINRMHRKLLPLYLDTYLKHGKVVWIQSEIHILQEVLKDILEITTTEFQTTCAKEDSDNFIKMVSSRLPNVNENIISIICQVMSLSTEFENGMIDIEIKETTCPPWIADCAKYILKSGNDMSETSITKQYQLAYWFSELRKAFSDDNEAKDLLYKLSDIFNQSNDTKREMIQILYNLDGKI